MRVLLAGESWVTHSVHVKGVDSFDTSTYTEGGGRLIEALEAAGLDVAWTGPATTSCGATSAPGCPASDPPSPSGPPWSVPVNFGRNVRGTRPADLPS
jgi:hypothetical protein